MRSPPVSAPLSARPRARSLDPLSLTHASLTHASLTHASLTLASLTLASLTLLGALTCAAPLRAAPSSGGASGEGGLGLTAWGEVSVGGALAPERSGAARAALPWRPREASPLYPARLDLGGVARAGAWALTLEGRLAAASPLSGSGLEGAYPDPRGGGPGLNTLTLTRAWRLSAGGLDSASGDLEGRAPRHRARLAVGVFLPARALCGDPEERARAVSDLGACGGGRPLLESPLALHATERLWARAPSPLDRAALGALAEWRGRGGWAVWPARASFALFTPSEGALPDLSAQRVAAQLGALWGEGGGGEGGGWVAAEGGVSALIGEGVAPALPPLSAPPRDLRWASLSAHLPLTASPQPALAYTGRLGWREARSGLSPLGEARLAALDRDGVGLSALHALTWRPAQRLPSLSLSYEWLDPQVDFAYNTRHSLSLLARLAVFARAPWTLEVEARYAHLWSSSEDRLSPRADVATLALTWRPTLGVLGAQ
jgi:hypothetical protein